MGAVEASAKFKPQHSFFGGDNRIFRVRREYRAGHYGSFHIFPYIKLRTGFLRTARYQPDVFLKSIAAFPYCFHGEKRRYHRPFVVHTAPPVQSSVFFRHVEGGIAPVLFRNRNHVKMRQYSQSGFSLLRKVGAARVVIVIFSFKSVFLAKL